MLNIIHHFCINEDGAVTVDWVVLTAAVVGLAVAAYAGVGLGSSELALNIQGYLLSILPGGT